MKDAKLMIDVEKPVIALTFDDGPNTTTTVEVLDKLEKYGIVASFFVIGENISEETEDILKRAYRMGCEIDNHSFNHPVMSQMTKEEIEAQIIPTSEKIYEMTGKYPAFFRPPYIAIGPAMYENIKLPFICGYGAEDWEEKVSATERANRILNQAKDGAIILLHDMTGNHKTVEALDVIIPELKKQGYQFVTVSKLFEIKKVAPVVKPDLIFSCVPQTTVFQNPIIPGFHPDPSICRVGEDYYLVTSSFEYFPGIPLFHSKDLIHWEQIGHCITRNSQILLDKSGPNGMGVFAPTIRYHNKRFYVINTNVSSLPEGGGNFIIWTDDINGEWSEPVWLDLPGIDPSLFFDEDGRVYYTGSNGNIFMYEIDIKTGKLLSERLDIWTGTGGADPEGPHIYKINGYYYLLISEGGTSQCHMITMARSKNIMGPYESCPRNPVLTNRSLPLPVRAVGHADLIEAHDGSWWAVCLGIRTVPYPDRHHLGRETFLTPVRWDKDMWPVFGNNGSIDLNMEAVCLPEVKYPEKKSRDDFSKSNLDLSWNFIFNPDDTLWSLQEKKGWLTLKGNEVGLSDNDTSAWLGRRQEHMNCTARTKLLFRAEANGEEAGLSIFLNCTHHYEVALTMIDNHKKIIFRRQIGSLWKVENSIDYNEDEVILELNATPSTFNFSYIDKAEKSHFVGSGEVQYLSTEAGGRFTGTYIVLYATGNGKQCTNPASFNWFDYNY